MKALNWAREQFNAVATVINRVYSATWNALLAGISGFWAATINLVLNGVNAVIGMLNKIPGVDIDLVEKPAFVRNLENFAKSAGDTAKKEMQAVLSGQDFKEASRRAAAKNREWNSLEKTGSELNKKAYDRVLSAAGQFKQAAANIEAGKKTIDQFAKKATDTVAKWQADAQQKQNERNNAKQDTKPEQPRAAAAGAAPTLKRDRLMTDSLTKIGLYNFGPNSVKSIDRERNQLLGELLEGVNRINGRIGGVLS